MSAPRPTLFLAKAPEEALPVWPVLAGPWCLPDSALAGAELKITDPGRADPEARDDGAFLLPPEPLADPEALERAARQARRMVAGLASRLAVALNARHGVARSSRYWDVALAPWLVRVAEVLVDRLYRAESLLRCFGERELRVPLLPGAIGAAGAGACRFDFASTGDFVFRGILNPEWNHWLLSRLLERRWPAAWEKIPLDPVRGSAPPPPPESLPRRLARHILFSLPFPRVKGFGTGQSLRLSLALLANRAQGDDTLPLAALGGDGPATAPGEALPLGWTGEDSLALALALLPRSLARIPARLERSFARTRVVSVAACEDDAYRLRAAAWRERGCRLVFIQHGGEYGYARTCVAYPLVEYCQHRFITWGWTRHGSFAGHFLPLPHPQLAAVRGRRKERETGPEAGSLLLVGTEMALLPYTLKSMLRGRQFFAYRQAKARFLAALPGGMRERAWYRPYFDVPSSLPDAPWLLGRFPEVRRCVGPLEPALFACRLLVLDHIGTTLAQALATDVPTVLFRDPRAAGLTPEAEALLHGLRRAGVLHDTPEAAAGHAARVWGDVAAWWGAAGTRAAVADWARQHALTPDLIPPDPLSPGRRAEDLLSPDRAAVAVLPLWAEALRTL